MRSRKVWAMLALAAMLLLLGGAAADSSNKSDGSGGKSGKRFGKGARGNKGDQGGQGFQQGGRGGRGLTADQIVERLLSFDKNKDGKLTKDELPERMQDLVAKGDTNKDGALDKDEIKALAAKLAEEGFGDRGGRGGRGAGFQGPRGGGGFGGFGGGLVFLADQKSVREELKMTEEQVKKVEEFREKARGEGFRGGRGGFNPEEFQKRMEERTKAETKALAEILKPEQLKRLKQISWQREGTRALGNEEVAEALKLSTEQKDKIKTIREDSMKEMRELFGGGGRGGNREEARKKFEDLRKATDEKIHAVLTAEQKTKLKELTGEPFKGEIQQPQFRPGGGGRRPQPGARTEQPKKEEPKATEAAKTATAPVRDPELDKKLERIIKELEDLRKELRR
jgi:Spy/CpxP family protein refolding chaperone